MPDNFAHLGGLNAYEVLGVEQTATTAEIEAAYRAAIKRQHSDTGGVNRLAQLINDARDALVKQRASYDAWLRNPTQGADGASEDDVWDPWETYDSPNPAGPTPPPPSPPPPPPPQPAPPPPPPPRPTSAPETPSDAKAQSEAPTDTTSAYPASFLAGESPEGDEDDSAISEWWAVLASVLCGPLGLWLGIRSYRRRRTPASVVAIVVGGMSVLLLATVAIAILLGVFNDAARSN
jgi:curved DNA-binding protein CbpA